MAEERCLQCDQITNETFNRVIRDSCGHYKCRSCLLKEDIQCLACDHIAKDFLINSEKSVIISTIENKRSGVKEQVNTSERNVVIDCSKKDQNCSVIVSHSVPATKRNVIKKSSRKKKALPSHILLESGKLLLQFALTIKMLIKIIICIASMFSSLVFLFSLIIQNFNNLINSNFTSFCNL